LIKTGNNPKSTKDNCFKRLPSVSDIALAGWHAVRRNGPI
jgi:hypothetical protein